MNIEALKEQINLLSNNGGVLTLTKNYITQQQVELKEIKKLVLAAEERNTHIMKACQIAEEGYLQIHKDITNLIKD